MKKQVIYHGKLFDLDLDSKNNLTLTESAQKLQSNFCSAYYCKSGKNKKWKVEFNKSFMAQLNKDQHINWVSNEDEAREMCLKIDAILKPLVMAFNITKQNKINRTIKIK